MSGSALITGGSRGIGLGVAMLLAGRGWRLTLCARGAAELGQARSALLATGADRVEVMAGDLADAAEAERVVAAHQAVFGDLDVLVLAAGVGSAAPLAGYPMRRLDKQFAVNVRAPFALVAAALPLLRAAAARQPDRGGRVIAIASVEAAYPEPGLAAYGASKAALVALMRSINIEENRHGVVASAILPGYVNTALSAWTHDTVPPETMLAVADVVKAVDLVLGVSANAVLPELILNRVDGGAYHA